MSNETPEGTPTEGGNAEQLSAETHATEGAAQERVAELFLSPEITEKLSREARPLSPEIKAEIFNFAIEKGVTTAIDTVRERFEDPNSPENQLAFHNTRHTGDVVRRFSAIIEAIRKVDPSACDDRGASLGRLAAAHHDTVQNWEPSSSVSTAQDGTLLMKIMRKRFAGANEAASSTEAIAIMEKINEEAGGEIFSETDKCVLRAGHEATIPGFDPEHGTVVQPKLTERSSIITRAIALADLGTAGMDGPEKYLPEGDALFREENLDIVDAMKNPAGLTEVQKDYYKARMLAWSSSQSKFARGRKELLNTELNALPDTVREDVAKLFDKFEASIAEASLKAEDRKILSFEDLARDMGYDIRSAEQVVY